MLTPASVILFGSGGNYGWAVAVRALDRSNINSLVVASSEFVPPGGRRLSEGDEWRDLGATSCGVTREVKVCGHHNDYGSAEQHWWTPFENLDSASTFASSWIDPSFDGESRPRLVVKFGILPSSGEEGEPCDHNDDCNEGLTCIGGEGVCSALAAECSAMPVPDVFVMETDGKKYMVTTTAPGADVEPLVTIDEVDYYDVGGGLDSGLRQSTCHGDYADYDDDYSPEDDDDLDSDDDYGSLEDDEGGDDEYGSLEDDDYGSLDDGEGGDDDRGWDDNDFGFELP